MFQYLKKEKNRMYSNIYKTYQPYEIDKTWGKNNTKTQLYVKINGIWQDHDLDTGDQVN